MATRGGAWPFWFKKSISKRCDVGRGSAVAEGGSATSEKCVLMIVAMGEPSADEDESAIIV
jgi:hypothetical protein